MTGKKDDQVFANKLEAEVIWSHLAPKLEEFRRQLDRTADALRIQQNRVDEVSAIAYRIKSDMEEGLNKLRNLKKLGELVAKRSEETDDVLVNSNAAARAFGTTGNLLKNWGAPGYVLGGKRYYRVSELRQWLDEQRKEAL